MLRFAILVLLSCAISTSAGQSRKCSASHSGEYGGYGGTRFSQSDNQLDGPITALEIRASQSQPLVTGLRVRFGRNWSDYVGSRSGDSQTIQLLPGESIIQVTGKADSYLRKLTFLTNFERSFSFGGDAGTGFTARPLFPRAILSYLSGRADSYIYSIGFYWNVKCNPGSGQ